MKKITFIIVFFISFMGFSQSNITAAQAMKSSDPKVIAGFIKNNPTDPQTPALKQKLMAIINNAKPKEEKAQIAKPVITPMVKPKVAAGDLNKTATVATPVVNPKVVTPVANPKETKPVAGTKPIDKHEKTAELLNHMFNNDPTSKEAYVQIVNKSKCNLIVKISGKKYYNLNVPASNQNFILIDKGTYVISTNVCDAKYSSTKNISKDIVLTLNAPK